MTMLHELLAAQNVSGYVAFVGAALLIAILLVQLLKPNKKQLPPLPPQGPSFAEFFDCIKADQQLETIKKYGDYWTTPSPLPGVIPTQVFLNDPKLVKYLCVKQANMYHPPSKFTTRTDVFAAATRSVVGVGVTGLKGEEWRWRKNALLKEFHKQRMLDHDRKLLDKLVQQGKRLCDKLGEAADSGTPIAVDVLTTEAAVGVILFFLFGRDLEFDTDEIRQAAKDLMECLGFIFSHPFHNVTKYIPGSSSSEMEKRKKRAWKIVDGIVAPEIKRLLDEHAGTVPTHPERTPGSVIASLIANEPRFRQGGVDSMIAEGRVFVQAGFETTAHSLAFSFGMMAERPDLANEMAKVGRQALGEDVFCSDKIQKALEETTLIKNFFMESLRLYPLAPALGGLCTDDIVVQTKTGVEYGLPKGTSVIFPNMSIQRQATDPDTIRPERWETKPQPFLHTFQNGAHACPGRPLSLLEGHIFLLLAVVHFEFSFPEGTKKVEYEDQLLLRPKDGMPLLVQRRN